MAPRTPAQNQALRDSTRARILEGALKVFSRSGYGDASIRMIAREAGIAQGLLYRHFPGKAELLRAIFERSMEDVRLSFSAASVPGPGLSLEALIRSSFAIVRGNLEFWRLSYSIRMQEAVLKALGPDLHAWTGEILGVLESLFRAEGATDPALEAALLFAAIDGISQHYALDSAHYPLEAIAETLIARYRHRPKPKGPGTRAMIEAEAKPGKADIGKAPKPEPEKAEHHGRKHRKRN